MMHNSYNFVSFICYCNIVLTPSCPRFSFLQLDPCNLHMKSLCAVNKVG